MTMRLVQAARQQSPSVTTSVGPDGLTKVITFPDGQGGQTRISIDKNGVQVGGDRVSSTRTMGQRDIPPNVMELFKDASIVICVVLLGVPFIRVFGRWLDRRGVTPRIEPDVVRRLEAIEQAVEAVAIEVERISEGQRFTTKLLSDRAQGATPEFLVAGRPEAVERARG